MKLLAFETATEACSVALYIDGEICERHEVAPRLHAEYALPWAEQLLADAGVSRSQLDVIAISRGPGAFTGVRLAIALAQGIALALDKPVVAVSTLQAIAMQSPGKRILAAIDARMGEVYAGAFERNGDLLEAISMETVGSPASVTLPGDLEEWQGAGTGFSAAEGALASHLASRLKSFDAAVLPRAADVARLAVDAYARGEAVAPEKIEPAYLRNNVALTLLQQQEKKSIR